MRFFLRSLPSIFLIALTAPNVAVAQEAPSGNYDIGDCLVGAQFSTCRTYLIHRGQNEGIDYLAEINCPNCVPGQDLFAADGITTIPTFVCPMNDGWSAPKRENLDVLNQHFDFAEDHETGATVIGFDERVCWNGGDCEVGNCEQFLTGMTNSVTGQRERGWRCFRVQGKVFYIVMEFGTLCTNNIGENMEGEMENEMGDGETGVDMDGEMLSPE